MKWVILGLPLLLAPLVLWHAATDRIAPCTLDGNPMACAPARMVSRW